MKALVTGGAGFIGSHLVRRLVADGHEVRALDDLSDAAPDNLEGVREVEIIQADLRDARAVLESARGAEVIFHQGAKRSVPRSIKEPRLTTEVNVNGTLNVLMAAVEIDARVVFASSSSVYGEQDTFPLREDMAPLPRSPYAASKLAGEAYCRAWTRSWGVPTVSMRYFNVYGPRQDPLSEYAAVIPRFILACLDHTRPEIQGTGEQARDFTYIDDVVEANVLAAYAGEGAWGRVLNVGGGGRPTSVNELLAMISIETGFEPDPVHTAPREGDVFWTEADVSLAKEVLGYRPAVPIDEGVRKTVEWFSAQR
jgi:nucleoside-diphosphate-sugar epimerase